MYKNQINKTISIICTTYNADKYIRKFISSVRNQTNKDFELIIVDGHSSDNTLKIIKSNNELIDNFISEPDKGIYDGWNKGIRLAKGDWLSFVGADDELKPNYVELYLEALKECPENTHYVSSKVNYISKFGKILRILGGKWEWDKFKYRMTTAHVGSLHKSELFKEIGLYDINYRIVGDYELLLRKKANLNTFFFDEITVDMLADGISLSYKSLLERKKAQIFTAKISIIKANVLFVIGILTLIKLKFDAK
jgi:glycosyltransferase involved in cell wall biosynthesis